MSRTQSQGLDYFPLTVDFFSDPKIRILKARYGADGLAILIYILCQIYREGYYTRVDEDFIFMISDELHISSETVQQVMTFLLKRSMFNEQLFKSDAILTSDGIQERWQKAVETRAAKTHMKVDKFWLLPKEKTRPFISCAHFSDNSEKKDDNSEKKDDNSENYPQSKVKESKVKESRITTTTTRAHVDTDTEEEKAPSYLQVAVYMRDELCVDNAAKEAEKFCAYNAVLKWSCLPDWKAAADLWCARIGEKK